MNRLNTSWREVAESQRIGKHPADRVCAVAFPFGTGLLFLGWALWRGRHVG